jgi:D-alanyl-D-alanine dipeptidase
MTISEKIKRSRLTDDIDSSGIKSLNRTERFVSMQNSAQLTIDPIWENPVDDIEGPLYQEYMRTHPNYKAVYLRSSVAEHVYEAAQYLPKRFRLILRAGHRPIAVQLKLLQSLVDEYTRNHHGATPEKALEHARTFVSDPSLKLPPHCCGAAVDVDVLDTETDLLVDFGCQMNTDSEIAFLHSDKISKQQRQSRMMLLEAMLRAGFASLPSEWWHYSYGDQNWAFFHKKDLALYSIAEPDL